MKKTAIFVFAVILLMITFAVNADITVKGAKSGLLMCGNVIIPSLFPFTVLSVFLINCGFFRIFSRFEKTTLKLFGLNADMFAIFTVSLIAGYPVGSKLINDYCKNGDDKSNCRIMQCFCVNAGPGFLILAVGGGFFHSKTVGIILFVSHTLASFINMLIFSRFIKNTSPALKEFKAQPLSENFTGSVESASKTVISVCAFIILFSVICEYAFNFLKRFPMLKAFTMFLEVTNALKLTNNVYSAAFILGFSGFSVWLQILSVSKNCGMNLPLFAISRVTHGGFSALITYILIKLFGISLPTISTAEKIVFSKGQNGMFLSVCLLIMVAVLFCEISRKNKSGKIFKNVL